MGEEGTTGGSEKYWWLIGVIVPIAVVLIPIFHERTSSDSSTEVEGIPLKIEERASDARALEKSDSGELKPLVEPVTLRVISEEFVGYNTFRSPFFHDRLKEFGIELHYERYPSHQDAAEIIDKNEAEIVLAPISALLRHPCKGKIAAIIDYTSGADALILNTPRYANLTTLQELKKMARNYPEGKKPGIAWVTNSPSDLIAIHLDFDNPDFSLSEFEVVYVENIEDTVEIFKDTERDVLASITFEPTLTRARREGCAVAFSSREIPEQIVDVLVVSDQAIEKYSEAVQVLIVLYYESIDRYSQRPEIFRRELLMDLGFTEEEGAAALSGLTFLNARQAFQWFDEGKLEMRIAATGNQFVDYDLMTRAKLVEREWIDSQFIARAREEFENRLKALHATDPSGKRAGRILAGPRLGSDPGN